MADEDVTREEIHHRRIDMRGFRRSDGLYELEGRVTDRKPFDFRPGGDGEIVPAQQGIHDMGVRLVFDEHMVVHDVTTFMDATPYPACLGGGAALQSLKGLRIGGGWIREVRSRLGGGLSCTHLMELLTPMATAAIQALSPVRNARPDRWNESGRPAKLDSCYAYRAESEVVKRRWPAFYRPAPPETQA
jgi:Protein of unknown function (DUF2889)